MRSQNRFIMGALGALTLALATIPIAEAQSSAGRALELARPIGFDTTDTTEAAASEHEGTENCGGWDEASSLYSVRWVAIGNGGQSGGTLPGGEAVNLQDSIGQPVAGTAEGGRFRLKTFLNYEVTVFADGFESGDTSAWVECCPNLVPPHLGRVRFDQPSMSATMKPTCSSP